MTLRRDDGPQGDGARTDAAADVARTLRGDNLGMVTKLMVIATLMFAFGYALVPIYRAICTALGINVLSLSEQEVPGNGTGYDPRNAQIDHSRTITVEFDANARGVWDFRPAQRSVDVHPGELTTVVYRFRNTQDHTMTAQAIPSYAPKQAMAHFTKVECFCFSEHTLKAGESKEWPVVFVVDKKLPKDIKTITLSYTFFEVGGRTPQAPQARYDEDSPQARYDEDSPQARSKAVSPQARADQRPASRS